MAVADDNASDMDSHAEFGAAYDRDWKRRWPLSGEEPYFAERAGRRTFAGNRSDLAGLAGGWTGKGARRYLVYLAAISRRSPTMNGPGRPLPTA